MQVNLLAAFDSVGFNVVYEWYSLHAILCDDDIGAGPKDIFLPQKSWCTNPLELIYTFWKGNPFLTL